MCLLLILQLVVIGLQCRVTHGSKFKGSVVIVVFVLLMLLFLLSNVMNQSRECLAKRKNGKREGVPLFCLRTKEEIEYLLKTALGTDGRCSNQVVVVLSLTSQKKEKKRKHQLMLETQNLILRAAFLLCFNSYELILDGVLFRKY